MEALREVLRLDAPEDVWFVPIEPPRAIEPDSHDGEVSLGEPLARFPWAWVGTGVGVLVFVLVLAFFLVMVWRAARRVRSWHLGLRAALEDWTGWLANRFSEAWHGLVGLLAEPGRQYDMDPSRPLFRPAWRDLGFAWVLCFAARALFVWGGGDVNPWTPETWWENGVLVGTSLEFDQIRPPLFSLLAKLFWWLGGRTLEGWLAANMVVLGLTGPVVLSLSCLLGFQRAAAWAVTFIAAVAPFAIETVFGQGYLASLWQLPMNSLVFTAMLLAFVNALRHGFRLRSGLLFSLAAQVAFLDRPNVVSTLVTLYMLAAVRGVVLARRDCARVLPGIARLGVSLAVLGLLLLGVATTYRMNGLWFSPFPPQGGPNVFFGNNPYVAGAVCDPDCFTLEMTWLERGPPETSFEEADLIEGTDRSLMRTGLAYAFSHPAETLKAWPCKAARYWGGPPLLDFLVRGHIDPSPTAVALVYHVLVLLGLILLMVQRRWWVVMFLVLVPLSYFMPYLLLGPVLRYRLTTELLLVVLAGYGVQQSALIAWRFVRRRLAKQP
jgi:hypothetical protein